MHDSRIMENTLSFENNNTDGTKNMTVTITTVLGDDPYVCIASFILGSGRHVTHNSSILLTAVHVTTTSTPQTINMTTGLISTSAKSNGNMISEYPFFLRFIYYFRYVSISMVNGMVFENRER